VYLTPEGLEVGGDHPGPKRKIADSRAEYRRYRLLCSWQAAGLIAGLRWQQKVYKLHEPGGGVVTTYRPDAVYILGGRLVVEDVKGRETEAYKIKRRWVRLEYGITITEV
jgi:hypothetical protein